MQKVVQMTLAAVLTACGAADTDEISLDRATSETTAEPAINVGEGTTDAIATRPQAKRPIPGRGHTQLCSDLRLISNTSSDEASDAYGKGDKKAGDAHA